MAEMKKVKRVIQATMKHKGAKLLFNQPVDPEALGLSDYFEVIKHPIDLATILERLNADDYYASASEVYADASQVWKNCRLYNSRPSDQPVRDLCADVEGEFKALWDNSELQKAELSPEPTPDDEEHANFMEVQEGDVPDNYNVFQEPDALPLRMVTDYVLCSTNNAERLVPLKARCPYFLQGTLVNPDSDLESNESEDLHRVQTGPIVDWCFQYSDTASIWVITQNAWYRLVDPAERYLETHQPDAEKLAICGAAVQEMQEDPATEILQAMEHGFAAQPSAVKPDMKLRKFVEMQLRAWIQANLEDEEEDQAGDVLAVPAEKVPDPCSSSPAAGLRRGKRRSRGEEEPDSAEKSQRRKRRKQDFLDSLPQVTSLSSPASGNGSGTAAEELPDKPMESTGQAADKASADEDTKKTVRQRAKEAADRKAKLAAEAAAAAAALPGGKKISKAQRDRESDAKRGPPPPAQRKFRVPAALLPDIITTWELLHTLGAQLRIPPFPLWRLEAAICPGPHPPQKQPWPDAEHPPDVPPGPVSTPGNQAEHPAPGALMEVKPEQGGKETEQEAEVKSKEDGKGTDAQEKDDRGSDAAPGYKEREELDDARPGTAGNVLDADRKDAGDHQRQSTEHPTEHQGPPLDKAAGLTDVTTIDTQPPTEQPQAELNGDSRLPNQMMDAETGDLNGGNLDAGDSAAPSEEPEPGLASVHESQSEYALPPQKRRKRSGRPSKRHKPLPAIAPKSGLRLHLKWGGTEISQLPADTSAAPSKESVAIDREVVASAVVLREVHCALLHVIEGQPLSSEGSAPTAAQLILPPEARASQAQWCDRAANAIFQAQEAVEQDAWDAALQLSSGEYWELTPERRVALLRCLTNLALSAEPVRDLFQAQAESLQLIQKAKPPKAEETTQANAVSQAAIPPPPGSVEEWMDWRESVKVTMRKPLGVDFAKRRYWAIGGRAACWRIYVEEAEGNLWGWYEGKSLCNLVEWLREGAIDREAALIRVLSKAPLPKKFISQPLQRPVPGRPIVLPQAANPLLVGDEDAASSTPSFAELSSKRLDGMRGKIAPLLRGEGNWPDKGAQTSFTRRIFLCIDALLGDLTFWFKSKEEVQRHVNLLEAVKQSVTTSAMGKALLAVEQALFEGACLDEEWSTVWRQHWREEIATCSHLQESLLHVAALQEHAIRQPEVLPRPAFVKIAKDCSCQLRFPLPGDEIAAFKSGILQHLRKYMQDLGLEAADPPSQPVRKLSRHEASLKLQAPEGSQGLNAAALLPIQAAAETPSNGDIANGWITSTDNGPVPSSQGILPEVPESQQTEAGEDAKPSKSGIRHLAEDQQEEEADGDGQAKLEDTPAVADTVRLAAKLPAEEAGQLKSQWEGLKAAVESLHPVESFSIISISYRRNMLEGSAAERFSREEEHGQEAVPHPTRWPVAWLVLKQVTKQGPQQQGDKDLLVLPLRIDIGLPDYLTSRKEYTQSMELRWEVGQRFQMFFASKSKSKGRPAGVYYKGTVAKTLPRPEPDAPQEAQDVYDPWEAIQVEWDASRGHAAGECENVNPWEIERDPEDEEQIEQDRLAQEAKAAALLPVIAQAPILFQEAPPMPMQQAQIPVPPAVAEDQDPGRAERERKRRKLEDDMDWDPYGPDSPQSSGGGEWKPSKTDRTANRPRVPVNTSGLSTRAPQEVLDTLQPLSRDRFLMLVGNWYRLNRGRFKIPIFAHQELDLHRVFWEVQARGGSDMVTAEKMWKEICRSLGVNLKGQTSASYNMRLNYERCLLEFEHYISNGQYLMDLANNQGPSPDVMQHAPPSKQRDSLLPSEFQRPRDSRVPESQQVGVSGTGLDLGFSFTRLLGLEEDSTGQMGLMQPPPLGGLTPALEQPQPPWRRLVAPPGTRPQPPAPGKGWLATVFGVPPAFRGIPSLAPMVDTQPELPALDPGADPAADPTPALLAAIQAGYTATDLHQLVDHAMASLAQAEPSPSPPPFESQDLHLQPQKPQPKSILAINNFSHATSRGSAPPPAQQWLGNRSDTFSMSMGSEGAEATAGLMMLDSRPHEPETHPSDMNDTQPKLAGRPRVRRALSVMADIAAGESEAAAALVQPSSPAEVDESRARTEHGGSLADASPQNVVTLHDSRNSNAARVGYNAHVSVSQAHDAQNSEAQKMGRDSQVPATDTVDLGTPGDAGGGPGGYTEAQLKSAVFSSSAAEAVEGGPAAAAEDLSTQLFDAAGREMRGGDAAEQGLQVLPNAQKGNDFSHTASHKQGEYGAILSPQGEANTKQGRSPVRNMQNVAADSANPEATTAKAKAKVKIKFSGMQTS